MSWGPNSESRLVKAYGFQGKPVTQNKEEWLKAHTHRGKVTAIFENDSLKIYFDNEIGGANVGANTKLTKWVEEGKSLESPITISKISPWQALDYMGSGDLDLILFGETEVSLPSGAAEALLAFEELSSSESNPEKADKLLSQPVPEDAFLLNIWGKIYALKGDVSKSAQCFRKAAEFLPDFSEPYNNLGTLMWNLGQRRESFILFIESLLKNPHNSSAQLNFFDAGYELEEYESVVKIVERLIEEIPSCIEFKHHLAICYRRLQRLEDAIKVLKSILADTPDDEEAVSFLRVCEEALKQ